MTEALLFVAGACIALLVSWWIDEARERRDARRRNQARPRGWR